jgi:hypothetical protein
MLVLVDVIIDGGYLRLVMGWDGIVIMVMADRSELTLSMTMHGCICIYVYMYARWMEMLKDFSFYLYSR